MALAGKGAICIWNDITPEGREEFYAWHLHEHMPERAAVPGFLRSRRFIALDGATQPEFFTLYETHDASVHTSAPYLARLNAPTPWTRTATQAFRNTSRALTVVQASFGPGAGGVLATIRFAVEEARRDEVIVTLSGEVLPAMAALPEIAGVHLCTTDKDASASKTAESKDRKDILAAPDWVVLIEGCGDAAVMKALAIFDQQARGLLMGDANTGLYRLEYQC
ncbi:MAG: hypothetical protein CFE31_16865 [Rhizobiales bacterium PAR1]|nr:MAG: hypothetical protein CFE31_16865 [Rhizobiales bacterium PAR1]